MRRLQFVVTICIMSATLSATDNPFLGTWKINAAKSKYSPGPAPKSMTVTYEADGDKVLRRVERTDGNGKRIRLGDMKDSSVR